MVRSGIHFPDNARVQLYSNTKTPNFKWNRLPRDKKNMKDGKKFKMASRTLMEIGNGWEGQSTTVTSDTDEKDRRPLSHQSHSEVVQHCQHQNGNSESKDSTHYRRYFQRYARVKFLTNCQKTENDLSYPGLPQQSSDRSCITSDISRAMFPLSCAPVRALHNKAQCTQKWPLKTSCISNFLYFTY